MFRKPDSDYPFAQPDSPVTVPRAPSESRREWATIGPSISIKGDLSGEEDIVIQGRIEGKVDLKQNAVTIGKNGRAKAEIHAKVITVEGEVEGNLYGLDQIIIRNSGSVRGNLLAPRVAIEDGARFKGTIDMEAKPVDKPRPVAAESKAMVAGASGGDQGAKAGIPLRAEPGSPRN